MKIEPESGLRVDARGPFKFLDQVTVWPRIVSKEDAILHGSFGFSR
jgi:hypothetical protein